MAKTPFDDLYIMTSDGNYIKAKPKDAVVRLFQSDSAEITSIFLDDMTDIMPSDDEYLMDTAARKLWDLHRIIMWILRHSGDFPKDLYRMQTGEDGVSFIRTSATEIMFEIARCDLANIIQPGAAWRTIGKYQGLSGIGRTEVDDIE